MNELQSLQNDVDTIINTKVKQNNARQITGIVLNGVLRSITSFVTTAIGLFYTKKEIDDKLTAIELTPGPKGDKGEPGAKGADGYVGADGKSSFQVWQAIAGNEAKTLADYWSFLSTTGGFSFNLIYYNNTELVMSQPKDWTIKTVSYTSDITLLEYSINNAAYAAITNGANNISIAANAIINFRITFAPSKIQTSINLTGIY